MARRAPGSNELAQVVVPLLCCQDACNGSGLDTQERGVWPEVDERRGTCHWLKVAAIDQPITCLSQEIDAKDPEACDGFETGVCRANVLMIPDPTPIHS